MELRCVLLPALALAVVCCVAVAVATPTNDRGKHCNSDRDCLFSMKCIENKCNCGQGYHLYKDSCLGGIGVSCNYDEDCIVDAYCKNHQTCACMENLERSEDGSKCQGNVTAIGRIVDSNCHENFYCEQFGLAFCETKTNLCQCRVDAHLKSGYCWTKKKLGENCLHTDECYSPAFIENIECEKTNHTCVCKKGTKTSDFQSCEGPKNLHGSSTTTLCSILALVLSYISIRIISS